MNMQRIRKSYKKEMTLEDLPAANTSRWIARRKAAVIQGVQFGLLSKTDACDLYEISEEEFDSWENAIKTNGINALKITKLQKYR
ncbi:DUF1153 domain-containing protein [Temperatibacter marinus]|uniref:DUF1153 domain-containing protein n=1 Tax=Temperatibacter marinus TaxID=1456591 RepID=A0AA52H927_9PROT|nr:DUF1153 domain-containing protein [Temperatibacter marinus]WND02736.1 DUF1153 domain-containing protein [Temperatibacter marinus]